MPNNKGGVPMYNENPQYNATINPQLPQGSPAMYGTQVAKEMAGYGDAMGKLGEKIVDYAVKRQQQEDDNYIMRRENDMREQLNNLLYNPQDGLANTKLHNAKGSTMAFDEAAEKLTQQFMSDVNNPYLQAKFQQRISQWLPGYRKNIAVHEGNETFSAKKVDIDTNIQDKIDSSLRAPGGQSASVLWESLGQNVIDLQNVLGMSKEAAAEYVQEKYSAGIMQMAETFAGGGDTQGLMDLQKATDGKVSAGVQAKLLAMTRKTQSQVKGIDIAKQYLNNPKYRNPDGTFNAVLAAQDFEKDHGPNATRTERVLVGGGGDINTVDGLMAAIGGQESGGDYEAQNGRTKAYGKYQIMPDNWPSWSEEAGLGGNAPQTPENQEKVARFKLNQYLQKYGAEGAMVAWYSGPGNAERWVAGKDTDVYGRSWDAKNGNGNEPSIREYVQQVSARGGKSDSSIQPFQMPTQGANIDEQVNNLQDKWKHGVMDYVGGVLTNVFGYSNPTISSAARSSQRNAEVSTSGNRSWHVHNDALDVVFDEGQDLSQDQKDKLVKYFEDTGMFSEVLYHDYGSGWHLHLGGLKSSTPPTGGGGGTHYEERVVSAYNEVEYTQGMKFLKEQGEYSKAQHDVVFNNALNDALGKVKSLRMPSEVMALAQSYGLNETDATRLYKVLLGNRLDLADEEQRFSDNQRARKLQEQAEDDAADNFYTWWNANPNASNADIQQKAADCGVSPKFMHSINNMIAKSSQGVSWFKSQYNKKVFNNAVSQNSLKGEQISNAMDIVTQKEAEKGSPLTAEEITTIVNKASAETVIYEGKWYERNVKGRAVDYPGGEIGKDRNGVDVTNEDGVNVVSGVDEDDFE